MNLVIYSAIYGRYDTPKQVHGVGAPALLFTDQPALVDEATDAGWQVHLEALEAIPTPMLRAKWWKCRPEQAAPDADAWAWIDGSMTPVTDYAMHVTGALADVDVALTPHPWRDCIYTELEASVGLPKYDETAMRTQCETYRRWGHPAGWGLFASGAIARRNTRPVVDLGAAWWAENLHRHHQDQLSLPVVLRNASGLRWAANMPWAVWWGITDHGVGL